MTDHQPAPETAESASALIGRLRELLKGADIPWALEQGELTGKNNRWVRIDDDRELTVFYKYGVGSVADCNKDEARARLIVAAVNELPGLLSLLTTQAAEITRRTGEKPPPNPEWEAKADAFHAETVAEVGVNPFDTLVMLEKWKADAEPANHLGQVSFSRAMLDSATDALRMALEMARTEHLGAKRLTERVERARGVIGPFGQFADAITGDKDGAEMWVYCVEHEMYLEGDVKASDFRAAADFLGETR